jgi:hypothetical protein
MKKVAISVVYAVSYCAHFLGFVIDRLVGWERRDDDTHFPTTTKE